MTGQTPSTIFMSQSAIERAFATAQTCADCCVSQAIVDRVLVVDLTRHDWGVAVRHSSTCPQLSPEQRAEADAFWAGLRAHDAADEEKFGGADDH